MADMIDYSTGKAAFASFNREPAWWGVGGELKPEATVQEWAAEAGLDWTAKKLQAGFVDEEGQFQLVEDDRYIIRSDNGAKLGHFTDGYTPVQPSEVLEFFKEFISSDERFHLDTAGALKDGRVIWALAKFNGPIDVVGDDHKAYALLTTSFDGSMATIAQATMIRVVCNNTLTASLFDKRAIIKARHNVVFDEAKRDQTRKQLAKIAQGVEAYKHIGEALASYQMSKDSVVDLFKRLLAVPDGEKIEEQKTKTINNFNALIDSLGVTLGERNDGKLTGWETLNAVTRYVDHDRVTRSSNGDQGASRLYSANFGSGASMKGDALRGLLEMADRPELLAA